MLGWGAQFGLVANSNKHSRLKLALLLGPTAWLTSYIVLPLTKVYKPIWDYDVETLAEDLGEHMAYGVATAATFFALNHRMHKP